MLECVYSPSSPFGKKSYSFYMQHMNANANTPAKFHGTCNRMRQEAAQYLVHLFSPISLPDCGVHQASLLLGENLHCSYS